MESRTIWDIVLILITIVSYITVAFRDRTIRRYGKLNEAADTLAKSQRILISKQNQLIDAQRVLISGKEQKIEDLTIKLKCKD